jgi:hypothetical protein
MNLLAAMWDSGAGEQLVVPGMRVLWQCRIWVIMSNRRVVVVVPDWI